MNSRSMNRYWLLWHVVPLSGWVAQSIRQEEDRKETTVTQTHSWGTPNKAEGVHRQDILWTRL